MERVSDKKLSRCKVLYTNASDTQISKTSRQNQRASEGIAFPPPNR